MSGGYSGKFSQRQSKIQLSRDNLGEQKVLESALSNSLKSKIFTTMVSPSEYNEFITNFPCQATWRLERMLTCSLFLTCSPFFVTPSQPTLIGIFKLWCPGCTNLSFCIAIHRYAVLA